MDDIQFAVNSLALSRQSFQEIGRPSDNPITAAPQTVEDAVDRIAALLLIRLIALNAVSGSIPDLSTTTISQAIVDATADCHVDELTAQVEQQLRDFVTAMLNGYHNDLPFHNFQHACHVVVSVNKLLDFLLLESNEPDQTHPTYGLKEDPLSCLALVFAALVHDVGHTGVTNTQRSREQEDLVEKYNDYSVHEQHSLFLAMEELNRDAYKELRDVMFQKKEENYESFKTLVSDAILSTDIASPVRNEQTRTIFCDAFPDAKIDEDLEGDDTRRRASMTSNISMARGYNIASRRDSAGAGSVSSEITMDSYSMMKNQQKLSRMTGMVLQQRGSSNGGEDPNAFLPKYYSNHSQHPEIVLPRTYGRRFSNQSQTSHYSDFASDSVMMHHTRGVDRRGSAGYSRGGRKHMQPTRRSSANSDETPNADSVFGAESINLAKQRVDGGHGIGKRHVKAKRKSSLDMASNSGFDDEDSSFSRSVTPPPFDDDDEHVERNFDGVVITGHNELSPDHVDPTHPDAPNSPVRAAHKSRRRSSNGSVPVKFGSIQGQRIREETPGEISGEFTMEDFLKRPNVPPVDTDGGGGGDQPDKRRADVVVALLLRLADVAHWFQDWETMVEFNCKFFRELRRANKAGRGHDPLPSWFDSQAIIMETYLLPLALQLDLTLVIGDHATSALVNPLEANHDLWLVKGFDVTDGLQAEEGA